MIAQMMPALYVAALYAAMRVATIRGNANQVIVIDALALNWLACTIAKIALDPRGDAYANVVPAYICIDMASALWLSLKVRGTVSGLAEIFYIALIVFNAAFFFARAFSPWTHWVGLSVISWGQLAAVTTGVLRHDLAKAAGHFAFIAWMRRHLAFRKKEARG